MADLGDNRKIMISSELADGYFFIFFFFFIFLVYGCQYSMSFSATPF